MKVIYFVPGTGRRRADHIVQTMGQWYSVRMIPADAEHPEGDWLLGAYGLVGFLHLTKPHPRPTFMELCKTGIEIRLDYCPLIVKGIVDALCAAGHAVPVRD